MKYCANHPDKKAYSICHGCGKDYCESCLVAGKEFYYCKSPECQILLRKESASMEIKVPDRFICPSCGTDLFTSKEEKKEGKIHCPECETMIDFNYDPPKTFNKENYVEFLSSLNQGDIALIKSIFKDGGIDYYTAGENFLSLDPLIVPAVFYVNEKQVSEAKNLLKDFKLNIFGLSTKN